MTSRLRFTCKSVCGPEMCLSLWLLSPAIDFVVANVTSLLRKYIVNLEFESASMNSLAAGRESQGVVAMADSRISVLLARICSKCGLSSVKSPEAKVTSRK